MNDLKNKIKIKIKKNTDKKFLKLSKSILGSMKYRK